MERARTILKEPFQLTPLFLGRPAEACRETDTGFLSRPGVLLRRGQIFEELADEFGAHAPIQQRQHFDCAKNASGQNAELLAGADVARRLHAVGADLHVACMAGLRGQRSAFVKSHRPKPLVDAHTFQTRHQVRLAPQTFNRSVLLRAHTRPNRFVPQAGSWLPGTQFLKLAPHFLHCPAQFLKLLAQGSQFDLGRARATRTGWLRWRLSE